VCDAASLLTRRHRINEYRISSDAVEQKRSISF